MKKLLLSLVVVLVLSVAGSAGGLYLLYLWASQDLPGFKKITDYNPPLVTTVYAHDGQVLGYFYKEKRFLAKLQDIPPVVTRAFLASEDSGFYAHEGVDLVAIFRASFKNLQHGGVVQGASTITQQVIKSMLLSPERSFKRKIREAILAYRLEKYLTKDEILTIYLNQIYLGAGAYGVEAASRVYFGVHVQDLTIAQAALLAGLPKAPTKYSPYNDLEAARGRQRYVLGRMLELGWITPQEHAAALEEPLVFKSMADPSWSRGAYYLEEVRRWLVDKFGEDTVYTAGMHVYTALDLAHQDAAERAMRDGLVTISKRHGWLGPVKRLKPEEYAAFLAEDAVPEQAASRGEWIRVLVDSVSDKGAKVRFGRSAGLIDGKAMAWARKIHPRAGGDARKLAIQPGDVVWASITAKPAKPDAPWSLALEQEPKVEGALVSIEPDSGEVRALVGGFSFARSQFNRATQAKRQPGSSFKPVVYSAAIDNGLTPASVVLDAPFVYTDPQSRQVWKPENYDEKYSGPTLLRTALAKSKNLVTIRVADIIGIDKVVDRAKALGLEGPFPKYLSISLGSVEVSPLNLCQAYTAFARPDGAYVRPRFVLTVESAWGEILHQSEPEIVPAISPATAFIITSMLQEVVRDGTATRAQALKRNVAGKTGTTNDMQDAWFMGYTPYLLTGVWVGYDQVMPMGKEETGGHAALPIWLDYRKVVEPDYPPQDFPMPTGVTMVRVDASTGAVAGDYSERSYFLPFKIDNQPQLAASPALDPGGTGAFPDTTSAGGPSPAATGEDLLKQVF